MKVKTQLLQKDIEAYFEAERELQSGRYGLTAETITASLTAFHKAIIAAGVGEKHYHILAAEFMQTLRAVKDKPPDARGPVANGLSVRAACIAGVIDGDADAVGELEPWEVNQLTNELSDVIRKAYEVPKN